jgi:hypothetical protein
MRPRRFVKAGLLVTAAALAAIIAGVYSWASVHARGGLSYFSPDTFQVRSQGELLLPMTDIPIWRSAYSFASDTYPLAEYLVANGHWKPASTSKPRWIVMNHWNTRWRDGQSTLYRYMRRPSEWKEWTEANKEVAAVLWPTVLSLLREGVDSSYVAHVMDLGLRASTIEELRERVAMDPELQHLGICVK